MSVASSETRQVPVDVLPPLPKDAYQSRTAPEGHAVPFEGLRTFYHPASGVVILGLDWLAFGTDLFTGFLCQRFACCPS
jgi:hypothetical protein